MIPKDNNKSNHKGKANKSHKVTRTSLHDRNKHKGHYDFDSLVEGLPELKAFVRPNDYGTASIDFFDPLAVKTLNKALLQDFYGIKHWEIPQGYLCPPVPGRADYIHHVADLLRDNNFGQIPSGNEINVLDVGTGANGVLAMVAAFEYGWSVVGSEIDEVALEAFQSTVDQNEKLKSHVTLRLQETPKHIFRGVVKLGETYDLTFSNPPFHSSAEESKKGSLRKLRNLKKEKVASLVRNFDGVSNELWCEGGELKFIENMILESKEFATQCFWFSTLVSKQSHLRRIHKMLRDAKAVKVETIAMGQGNKSSRIVAWTFLSKSAQQEWRGKRWINK